VGIARSLQHPGTEHPRDKRRAGFEQREPGPIVRLAGSKCQLDVLTTDVGDGVGW
jgi:hypothetical protein